MNTEESICRTGVTVSTSSKPSENRFLQYVPIDHLLFEAEESLRVTNFSYRTQSSLGLFTGSGYALIINGVDIINFGSQLVVNMICYQIQSEIYICVGKKLCCK